MTDIATITTALQRFNTDQHLRQNGWRPIAEEVWLHADHGRKTTQEALEIEREKPLKLQNTIIEKLTI